MFFNSVNGKCQIIIASAFFFVIFLTGCESQYWYQQGKTFEQCDNDRQQCLTELMRRSDILTITDYEVKFMEDCMTKKGYRLTKQKELPLNVKRQEAETSLHWRMKGIAGTISK